MEARLYSSRGPGVFTKDLGPSWGGVVYVDCGNHSLAARFGIVSFDILKAFKSAASIAYKNAKIPAGRVGPAILLVDIRQLVKKRPNIKIGWPHDGKENDTKSVLDLVSAIDLMADDFFDQHQSYDKILEAIKDGLSVSGQTQDFMLPAVLMQMGLNADAERYAKEYIATLPDPEHQLAKCYRTYIDHLKKELSSLT